MQRAQPRQGDLLNPEYTLSADFKATYQSLSKHRILHLRRIDVVAKIWMRPSPDHYCGRLSSFAPSLGG